jgi:hypothetical protein
VGKKLFGRIYEIISFLWDKIFSRFKTLEFFARSRSTFREHDHFPKHKEKFKFSEQDFRKNAESHGMFLRILCGWLGQVVASSCL